MSNYFVHDADFRRVKKHFAYFLSINSGYKLKCHKVSSVQGSAGEIFVKVMAKVVCNARRFMVTIFIVIVISLDTVKATELMMALRRGAWSKWSEWGPCSTSCGEGVEYKTRNCTQGMPGIGRCSGLSWEVRSCDFGSCGTTKISSAIVNAKMVNILLEGSGTANTTDFDFLTNTTNSISSQYVDCYKKNNAFAYRGMASYTQSGYSCQNWLSQTPHSHTFNPTYYPYGGLGDHSFCRSPDNDTRPWCFVQSQFVVWEFCEVPVCHETTRPTDCFDERDPSSYRGFVDKTEDGTPCLIWDLYNTYSHIYSSSRFPGKGLGNHNYCRNPDGDVRPWCFTTNPDFDWAYCDVDKCSDITPQPSTLDCGKAKSPIALDETYRILGSIESYPGSLPWQVALYYSGNHVLFCGASIISNRWIITAAHCISNPGNPSSYYGYVGKHQKYQREDTEKRLDFSYIIQHLDYNEDSTQNDITLIMFTELLEFTDHIQPVCIPNKPSPNNRMTIISGWGTSQGTGSTNVLRQASVPIITRLSCSSKLSGILAGMICAGFEDGGKDACQGDGGGPLVGVIDEGRYELVGIVSWGIGCARPMLPGVYTDVYYYKNWIKDIISVFSSISN
ncbi:plasminogen-like [Clavelina lepadiformis]|uniref:plasminogen-like n=1 Tax=Clavelina lepadiformis TaxID=159417 RepID=UPI0040425B9B